jgi:hemoglobin
MSIYDLLGREQGIRGAVDAFYERVLADPQVAHYFTGVDMPRLRRHQVQLLSAVTGGPEQYQGTDLGEAHRDLAISYADFDRVIGHLGATLADLGVDESTRQQVGQALTSYREVIVNEKASEPK